MAFPDHVSVYRSEVYERILAEQAGTETASDEDNPPAAEDDPTS